MKKVGIWALAGYTTQFWDDIIPAFDGMRWQIWNIVKELKEKNYSVFSLENAPLIPNELVEAQINDIDIAILHPRWYMFNLKYAERTQEYFNFLALFNRLLIANKRIVLLDYDLALTFNMIDELLHYNKNVRIVHPFSAPPKTYKDCCFLPFPFWAEGKFRMQKLYDAAYIGSEYGGERMKILQRFFEQHSGNNLVVGRWDNIPFNTNYIPRVSHPQAMKYLAQSHKCLWVARDDTVQFGGVTSKISESIAVGTALLFLQQTSYSASLNACQEDWKAQANILKTRIPEMDKRVWMQKFLNLLED